MDTDHGRSHQQKANNVPAGYETWRKDRWDEIAGPNGKAKVIANGRVTGRDTHVIPGVPGQWHITEAGALAVSAGCRRQRDGQR